MLTQQLLVNAIVLGAVFSLFALGLSLAWGALDVLNLAHGSMFVAGAWVGSQLSAAANVPFIVAVIAGMAAGAVLAIAADLIAFRPIRALIKNKRQAELSMVASTVGIGFILDSLIGKATSNDVFAFPPSAFEIQEYHLATLVISNIQIIIVVTSTVIAVALNAWISRSRQGMAIRAIAFSPRIPALLGVKVNHIAAVTMAVSGALAGLAGVLDQIWTSGMALSTGHSYLLKAFAIVILGGVGSIRGCVLAAYLLAFAETLIFAYGSAIMRDVAAFAVIMLVLLVLPQGLFGRRNAVRA